MYVCMYVYIYIYIYIYSDILGFYGMFWIYIKINRNEIIE
jgi:hypothetical protein